MGQEEKHGIQCEEEVKLNRRRLRTVESAVAQRCAAIQKMRIVLAYGDQFWGN